MLAICEEEGYQPLEVKDENLSGAFDEEQYLEEIAKELNAKLSAMTDSEFFALLDSVDKETKRV